MYRYVHILPVKTLDLDLTMSSLPLGVRSIFLLVGRASLLKLAAREEEFGHKAAEHNKLGNERHSGVQRGPAHAQPPLVLHESDADL